MVDWKERGYVPDSDDEDEDADPEINTHFDCQQHNDNSQIGTSDLASDTDVPPLTTATVDLALSTSEVQGHQAAHDLDIGDDLLNFIDTDDHGSVIDRNLFPDATSTATRLEAELNRGIKITQDVLELFNHQDDTDSPLSSPPQSLPNSPPRQASVLQASAGQDSGVELSTNTQHTFSYGPSTRYLRQRAPIQLHPYALEDAQYRQTLKGRGLKPVRLSDTIQTHTIAAQEDSQGGDTYHSSQLDERIEQIPPSSLNAVGEEDEPQSPVRGTRIQMPYLDLGGELPELADILSGRIPEHSSAMATDRPRLQRARKIRHNSKHHEYHGFDLLGEANAYDALTKNTRAVFQVPPSPPRSRGGLSSQDDMLLDEDQELRRETPRPLPTPLLSSEQRSRKRRQRDEESCSSATAPSSDDDASSSGASEESSEEEPQGVQQIQRKIRGVLPASWLRLDQVQQRTIEKQAQKRSPIKPGIEKGVARRVSGRAVRRTGFDDHQIAVHHDSDTNMMSDSEFSETTEHPMGREGHPSDSYHMDLDYDIVEDDTIDAMLPARSRAPSRRKKQRKLTGESANANRSSADRGVPITRKHAARPKGKTVISRASDVSRRPHKLIKTEHKNAQLSLFDAPGFHEAEIPTFLRVAARQKRKLGLRAEQDPSKKFFQFATKRDTADVRASLTSWRSRRRPMRQLSLTSNNLHSRPLTPQPRRADDFAATAQNQNTNTQLNSLKQSTESTLKRILLNQTQSTFRHTHSPSYAPATPGLLSSYFSPRLGTPRFSDTGQPPHLPVLPKIPSEQRRGKTQQPPRRTQNQLSISRDSLKHRQEYFATFASVRAERPLTVRRPRKQHPVSRLNRPNLLEDSEDGEYIMQNEVQSVDPPLGIDSLASKNDMIITHLIEHPPTNQPFCSHACLSAFSPLNVHVLQGTITSMTSLGRLFETSDAYTLVTNPESGASVALGKWSYDMQETMFELSAIILRFISIEPLAVQTQGRTLISCSGDNAQLTRQQHKDLLNRCQESLQSLIQCVNESLRFTTRVELDEFILCGTSIIEKVVSEVKAHAHAVTSPNASLVLEILNRVMIFSYQITKLAEYSGYVNPATERITEVHESVMRLTWSVALRNDYAGRLFAHFTMDADASGNLDPELEAIVVILQIHHGDFWQVYLDQFLIERLETPDDYPAEALAYTLLILGCVHCLVQQKDHRIGFKSNISNRFGSDGLVTLHTTVPAFMKFFLEVTNKHHGIGRALYMNKLRHFGSIAFKWCFLLVHNFGPNETDHLLKRILKCYGDNKMHDFYTMIPSYSMPDFLVHHSPATELAMETADTDFHIFLKLVASGLTIRQDPNEAHDSTALKKMASRKQSLVFSFLPNNSFKVDDDKALILGDLAAVANRYNLFSTMFHYSPRGHKPPLANIKDLVSFKNSHHAVCNLALDCWTNIAKSVLAQGAEELHLQELSCWIEDMFMQSLDKLRGIAQRDGESHQERLVNSKNREMASQLLCLTTQTWTKMIKLCINEHQARHLLQGSRLDTVMGYCYASAALPDHVIIEILNLLDSYLQKSSNASTANCLNPQIHTKLQTVISKHCTRQVAPTDDLLVSLMDTWYHTALSMVNGNCATWEDYINPASTTSVDMMTSPPSTTHCCALFLGKALAHKECFDTEPFYFFQGWLGSILAPLRDIKFQHLVSLKLLEIAPETLNLRDIAEKIRYKDITADLRHKDYPAVPFDRNSLIQNRLEIILHVIRNVHKLHLSASDETVGVLSKSQASRLLTLIQKKMKQTWFALDNDSKPSWGVFINKVIFEMDLYPVEGVNIDSFFTTPAIAQYANKALYLQRLFAKAFAQRQSDITLAEFKDYVMRFRKFGEAACAADRPESLVKDTMLTFATLNPDFITGDGEYALDIRAQMRFLKAVFPAYVARAFFDKMVSSVFSLPIIGISVELCKRVELRHDFSDMEAMESFAEFVVMLMHAVYLALSEMPCDVIGAYPWESLVMGRLYDLAGNAANCWANLKLTYPQSVKIATQQELVQTYLCYVEEWSIRSGIARLKGRVEGDMGFAIPEAEPGMSPLLQQLRDITTADLETRSLRFWGGPTLPIYAGRHRRYDQESDRNGRFPVRRHEGPEVSDALRDGYEALLGAVSALGF